MSVNRYNTFTHFCKMWRRSAATVSLECENISMSSGGREWPIMQRTISKNGLPHIALHNTRTPSQNPKAFDITDKKYKSIVIFLFQA